MNIQPGSNQGRRKTVSGRNSGTSGFDELCSLIARVGHAALVILIFGALFHTYIKLDNEIDSTEAEIRKTSERIALLDRDIEGLKVRYATCSSRQFIVQQIRKFGLKLEPVRHDQRQTMHIFTKEQIARMHYIIPVRNDVAMGKRR